MEEVGFVCLVTQVLWLEGVLYTGHWPVDGMSALVDANGFKTLRVLICVTKSAGSFLLSLDISHHWFAVS